jgi:hypothetical protein
MVVIPGCVATPSCVEMPRHHGTKSLSSWVGFRLEEVVELLDLLCQDISPKLKLRVVGIFDVDKARGLGVMAMRHVTSVNTEVRKLHGRVNKVINRYLTMLKPSVG